MSHRKVQALISGRRRAPWMVELSVRNGDGLVVLEISKGARASSEDLRLRLRLDEARELLRALQAAHDREHREAKLAAKSARALAELLVELESIDEGGT